MRGVLSWGPALLWAGVLFLLSESRGLAGVPSLPFGDKVAHVALYTVLGAALGWGRHASGSRLPHLFFLLLGALYGVSDEWHQSFVPGRFASAGDAIADAVGVLAGYLVAVRFLARRVAGGPGPTSPHPS